MFMWLSDFFWQAIDFLQTYNGAVTAAATVFIAVFTIVLAIVSRRQARLTRASIDLANKEFIASHRPRIRVRRITPIGGLLLPNTQLNFLVEAANIGDTKATVVEVGMDVYVAGEPFNAVPRPYPNFPPLIAGKEVRMTITTLRALSEAQIDAIEVGTSEWRLLGIINYADDNGVMRSTSLARVYNRAMGRFIPVTEHDPDADREFEN
jgi:hypothetical protein